jgi:hypothetical protein
MKESQEHFILINEIEAVRAKNNTLWMQLIRIAMELDPIRTKKILYDITQNDQAITYLMEQIVNIKG